MKSALRGLYTATIPSNIHGFTNFYINRAVINRRKFRTQSCKLSLFDEKEKPIVQDRAYLPPWFRYNFCECSIPFFRYFYSCLELKNFATRLSSFAIRPSELAQLWGISAIDDKSVQCSKSISLFNSTYPRDS
jgi:hypothetical protein